MNKEDKPQHTFIRICLSYILVLCGYYYSSIPEALHVVVSYKIEDVFVTGFELKKKRGQERFDCVLFLAYVSAFRFMQPTVHEPAAKPQPHSD